MVIRTKFVRFSVFISTALASKLFALQMFNTIEFIALLTFLWSLLSHSNAQQIEGTNVTRFLKATNFYFAGCSLYSECDERKNLSFPISENSLTLTSWMCNKVSLVHKYFLSTIIVFLWKPCRKRKFNETTDWSLKNVQLQAELFYEHEWKGT